MKEVIQYEKGMDHSPALIGIGVGQHNFQRLACWVAEKSDVDAAIAGAIADCKGHADWRVKQVADTKADLTYVREQKADLTYVQELHSRVEHLRCQMEKLPEVSDERAAITQKRTTQKIREDLETLKEEVVSITNQLRQPSSATEEPALRPNEPRDPTHEQIQEVEVRLLKRLEMKMREVDDRIHKLDQRMLPSELNDRLQTQVEQLVAWRSSSFLKRLLWLLRGC